MKNKVSKSSGASDQSNEQDNGNTCSRRRALFTEKSVPSIEGKEIAFIDDDNYQEAYEQAVNAWNSITAIPILDLTSPDEPPSRPPPDPPGEQRAVQDQMDKQVSFSPSSFSFDPADQTKCSLLLDQLTKHVLELDISSELTRIERHSQDFRRFSSRVKRLLFLGPPAIKSTLKAERDQIFALALKSFDNNDAGQVTLLTVLYQKLTRKPALLCPRIGNHWDIIGFQGIDPVSDLRGVGLLGLFQLVSFVLSPATSELAHQIYKLSVSSSQSFPFSALGMSISQITLANLRSGVLNGEINRRGSPVIRTVALFYASIFLKYFKEWRDNKRTIQDAGFVLDKIRKESSTKVHSVIVSILNYDKDELNLHKNTCQQSSQPVSPEESEVVFTDIWSKRDEDN